MSADHNIEASLNEKFIVFKRLLELCEARGYNPEGANLEQVMKYRGVKDLPCFDKNGKCIWALAWKTQIDYEEFGPQSGPDHPALLFITGREEWHDKGHLGRGDNLPSVITSKGTKYYINGINGEMEESERRRELIMTKSAGKT